MNRLQVAFVGALAVALTGCDDPARAERADADMGDESDTMDVIEVDAEAIVARAGKFATELTAMSDEPEYEETHADAAAVRVWASDDAAALFASIDPDDPTQNIEFSPGALIVKQHLDEAGATRGMSIMFKAETGYFPEGGDWFWARVDGEETTDAGPVVWCSGCHAAAHNSDFVVGFGKSP